MWVRVWVWVLTCRFCDWRLIWLVVSSNAPCWVFDSGWPASVAGVWFGAWLCGYLGLWLLYVSRFGVGLAHGARRA